tara:strand:- start:134 stop:736 length:603 start_codon:yes stop_codon:yes gene_type:complete
MQCIHDIDKHIKEIELRQDPVIIQVNDFNEEEAKKFRGLVSLAHNTGQKVIPVIIDSYGGQVYSLMTMISAIKSAKLPVATIVTGKAMSCGAILSSFGSEGLRFIDPDATIMIHDVSSRAFGKVEELKADASEADRLNKKVFAMMARNCGKPDDFFLKKIHDKGHADWFLNADEAIEIGIINFKRIPEMTIKISVDIDVA